MEMSGSGSVSGNGRRCPGVGNGGVCSGTDTGACDERACVTQAIWALSSQ